MTWLEIMGRKYPWDNLIPKPQPEGADDMARTKPTLPPITPEAFLDGVGIHTDTALDTVSKVHKAAAKKRGVSVTPEQIDAKIDEAATAWTAPTE